AAFTMLDESGRDVVPVSAHLPVEAPELCSAEFSPSGDLRFAVNRGGSLVCYFRSSAESVLPKDVWIEVAAKIAASDTISFLGDNVWQANILLDQPVAAETPVRLRLGEGAWSEVSRARASS
ncbi:MAG TPA: hypothetical protein VHZ74_26840, partial [Bryobacteraceae bacterium]|nr:hypothetical protein [Bryobacteraceae bacterium]